MMGIADIWCQRIDKCSCFKKCSGLWNLKVQYYVNKRATCPYPDLDEFGSESHILFLFLCLLILSLFRSWLCSLSLSFTD